MIKILGNADNQVPTTKQVNDVGTYVWNRVTHNTLYNCEVGAQTKNGTYYDFSVLSNAKGTNGGTHICARIYK